MQTDHEGVRKVLGDALGDANFAAEAYRNAFRRLEAENARLRAALENGCDLGLSQDECREALSGSAETVIPANE